MIDLNVSKEEEIQNILNNSVPLNEHFARYRDKFRLPESNNLHAITLMDLIKKFVITSDTNSVISAIDKCANKDYKNLSEFIGPNDLKKIDLTQLEDFYLLKNCIFVVSDLNYVLTSLRKLGHKVNKGPKSQREQLSSYGSFVSNFDSDYRNALYRHHTFLIKKGLLPKNVKLSRSSFNFDNVHKNIGNIKL